MFKDIQNIKNYNVYQYEHIDALAPILEPMAVFKEVNFFGNEKEENILLSIEEVKKLFKKHGWEGDGKIGFIWLPPFVDVGNPEFSSGIYLWHVKQSNNGISFIATPLKLKAERLEAQNRE